MKGGALTATQRQRLLGFLEQKVRLGPETVHIDIINACNLDCMTCWNYAPGLSSPKSAAWKAQRMERAVFHRVLGELVDAGVERIILSGGGEPFMHPDIHAFIDAVKAKGLTLTVISNGTLCDFPRLAESGVDQMLINMSSASARSYVDYHPNQNVDTFDQLRAGIASVRGLIAINLVQVINALNAHELVAMVELAAELGARASFKLGDTPPGTECFALSEAQRDTLIAQGVPAAMAVAETRQVKHNLDAFLAQITTCKNNAATPLSCFAGYLYSRVFVDGRVFFCCEHIDVGHIDDGNFTEIWHAAPYRAVRQRLHEGRAYPGCARCGKHDMNFSATRQLEKLRGDSNNPLTAGALPGSKAATP